MKNLPDRINCQQDEEDVYEHFAREANTYVVQRLSFEEVRAHSRRFFITQYDLRYVTKYQLEQMEKLTGDKIDSVIPMQAVLNSLREAQESLAYIAKEFGVEYDPLDPRDNLNVRYRVTDAIRKKQSA